MGEKESSLEKPQDRSVDDVFLYQIPGGVFTFAVRGGAVIFAAKRVVKGSAHYG